MHPDAIGLVLAGSIAGGMLGPLAVWNRRAGACGRSEPRRSLVLIFGSAAAWVAAFAFARAFGSATAPFAAAATLLAGAWTAVLVTALPLKTPKFMAVVTSRESKILRQRWTGVPLFGWILRATPLRKLGGSVYLRGCGNDFGLVLQSIREDEAVHVWSFLFCTPLLCFWLARLAWPALAASLAMHLLLNVCPVLHLRQARGRIESMLQRRRHLRLAENPARHVL